MIVKNLRQLPKFANWILIGRRKISSESRKLTSIEISDKTGIATLAMNRYPVNALNLDLLTEMSEALKELDTNQCSGIILATNLKSVFSAGFDLMEIYKPDQERLKMIWYTFQNVWLQLYGSKIPTAAAITGHAPGGGCIFAVSCEYRVMCPNLTIGLNETRLGMSPPKWFQSTMLNVLPTRIVESALTLGTMFSTEEALRIGLVDELATDKDEAISKCEKFLLQFKKISPQARSMTKLLFRRKDIEELKATKELDLEKFVDAINEPKFQHSLQVHLESLKKKQ